MPKSSIPLDWWPDWRGETIVAVASGPSAASVDLSLARGKAKIITINTSWKLAPDADMLFACDAKWWRQYNGCPEFKGLRVTIDRWASVEYGLHYVHCLRGDDRIQSEPKGTVGWGGNSGFHVLNLCLQFQVKRVLMVGYDMRTDKGLHWHGDHPKGMHNPKPANAMRWRKAIDDAAKTLKAGGLEVINCSEISALTAYPKQDFAEALG